MRGFSLSQTNASTAYNPTMLRWTFHILTLVSLVSMIASCVAVGEEVVKDFAPTVHLSSRLCHLVDF